MKWSILTLALVLVLSGCKKDIQNEASLNAGILKYLATRTNLNEMDVAVTAISFRQHEADRFSILGYIELRRLPTTKNMREWIFQAVSFGH